MNITLGDMPVGALREIQGQELELLEKKLKETFTCEEIIDTLRNMWMARPGEKLGYTPVYTRTDLTDALHETAGFRTDYQIISDINMRKIIRETKKKK